MIENNWFIVNFVNWADWCPTHGCRPCSDPDRKVAFLRGAAHGGLCSAYLIPKYGLAIPAIPGNLVRSCILRSPHGILMPS